MINLSQPRETYLSTGFFPNGKLKWECNKPCKILYFGYFDATLSHTEIIRNIEKLDFNDFQIFDTDIMKKKSPTDQFIIVAQYDDDTKEIIPYEIIEDDTPTNNTKEIIEAPRPRNFLWEPYKYKP